MARSNPKVSIRTASSSPEHDGLEPSAPAGCARIAVGALHTDQRALPVEGRS